MEDVTCLDAQVDEGIYHKGDVDGGIKQIRRVKTMEEHCDIPVRMGKTIQTSIRSETEESDQLRKHICAECPTMKEDVESRNPEGHETEALFEALDNIRSTIHGVQRSTQ